MLCLKGKLYKYHLTITNIESKLLNDRDEFLLVLSVIEGRKAFSNLKVYFIKTKSNIN